MNEIIIDGCNVAECEYTNGLYNGVYRCINLNLNPACSKNPNCYFKQLQRAEADIEELKESNDSYDEAVRALLSDKDKLQAENDTLHITISKLKADLSQAETSLYAWKAENEKLKAEIEKMRIECAECDLKNLGSED